MILDKYILGVNPMVGVDHFLRERVRSRALREPSDRMYRVTQAALHAGAEGINFSPSNLMNSLLSRMRSEGLGRFSLYPILPDTSAYADILGQKGVIGLISEFMSNLPFEKKVDSILRGSTALFNVNPKTILRIYLNAEISKLSDLLSSGINLRSIMLHEMFSDFGASLELREVVRAYVASLKENGITPGFVTRNFVRFMDFAEEANIDYRDIIVMTPINKIGFQMTPSKRAVEDRLAELRDPNIMAISILAGGYIDLYDAVDYVKTVPSVKSYVIGASTESHARETFQVLRKALS